MADNDLLMHKLARFYSDKDNMNTLMSFVDSKDAPISLRTIDYFVTKYSHKYNIVVPAPAPSTSSMNVYTSYKAQLKAFHKKLFDPFRRHQKIVFYFNDQVSVTTTIAQLNFFRWLIQNNIITYIISHKDTIIQEMESDTSEPSSSPSSPTKQEWRDNRHGLATNITLGPRVVSFE